MDISLPAAKSLAGWTDIYAPVYSPNLDCLRDPTNGLDVTEEKINRVIDHLVKNSFEEFKHEGRLRPLLRACIATIIMYDEDVMIDLGRRDNAMSLTLRQAFKNAKAIDSTKTEDVIGAIKEWGEVISKDYWEINPDFHTLTAESNSSQVVTSINQIGTYVAGIQKDNVDLKRDVQVSISEAGWIFKLFCVDLMSLESPLRVDMLSSFSSSCCFRRRRA